jgi:16S rRNA processing protein RimM
MLVIDENKNELLGEVKDISNFGSNECLIVKSTEDSIDDKERLIPFIRDNFISFIDKEKRIIQVNWKSNY